MNRTLALLPLGSLAFASLALGCGGDEAKRTSLTLTLRGPNDNHSAEIYGFPQETLSVIDAVRVTAMRGNEVIEQVEFDYEAYEGRLPTVPYGDDNWITVEALANDDVVASGASPRFSLAPGDAPLSLEVFTAVPREFTGTFKFDSELDQSVPSTYELPGGRAGAAVATLPDGRVVVIGGAELALGEGAVATFGTFYDTVQVYTPADGTWWTLTTPGCDVASDGVDACAVRLPRAVAFGAAASVDADRVVFSGGLYADDLGGGNIVLNVSPSVVSITVNIDLTAEIAPVPSAAGGGAVPGRAFHTATQMSDGRIAFIGGIGGTYSSPTFPTSIDEVLRAATLTYQASGAALTAGRALHSATNFAQDDHGIVVFGGRNASSVVAVSESVYIDGGALASEPFSARPGSVDLAVPRFGHAVAEYGCPGSARRYLFVAGGFTTAGATVVEGSAATNSVEVYDPSGLAATSAYTVVRETGLTLANARAYAVAAATTTTGDVLVAGGFGADGTVIESAELFENFDWGACELFVQPGGGHRSEVAGGLVAARAFAHAVPMANQFVLVTGGTSGAAGLASSELYNTNVYEVIQGTSN